MARPKKDKPTVKIKPIQIRFTEQAARDAYERKAKNAGLTMTAYINKQCIGKQPKEKDRVPTPEEEIQIKTLEAMQQIVKNSAALIELDKAGYSIPDNPLELIRSELRQIKHKLDTFQTKSDILSKPGSQT